MNLDDAWGHYYLYTGKISDIVRSSTLAGVAFIWIFRESGEVAELRLDARLVCAAVLFILTLLLDLAQYCAGAVNWRSFSLLKDAECERLKEDGRIKTYGEHDFFAPEGINRVAERCMAIKIIPFAVGYGFILCYLLSILDFGVRTAP